MDRQLHRNEAAIADMRAAAAELRRRLAEMRALTDANGRSVFSPHMIRMAEDSVDAAERYAAAARTRQKA